MSPTWKRVVDNFIKVASTFFTWTATGVQVNGTLDTSGALDVTGNTTLGGTLEVTGGTTLSSTVDVGNELVVTHNAYAPLTAIRTDTTQNQVRGVANVIVDTSNDALDGIGPGLYFSFIDPGIASADGQALGAVFAIRDGADNIGRMVIAPSNAGSIDKNHGLLVYDDETIRTGGPMIIGSDASSNISSDLSYVYSSTFPVARFIRKTADTTSARGALQVIAESTGNAADTYGPAIDFAITDTGVTASRVGFISTERNGADNTGLMRLAVFDAGTARYRLNVDKDFVHAQRGIIVTDDDSYDVGTNYVASGNLITGHLGGDGGVGAWTYDGKTSGTTYLTNTTGAVVNNLMNVTALVADSGGAVGSTITTAVLPNNYVDISTASITVRVGVDANGRIYFSRQTGSLSYSITVSAVWV